jgi:SAM-dependent methyltransferase
MLKQLRQSVIFPLALAAYHGNPFLGIARYFAVLRDFWTYRNMLASNGDHENVRFRDFFPFLTDKYQQAGNADRYFYQDTWCARKLAGARPRVHVDVGSQLISMGILSQFMEIIYVDVRSLQINLAGFFFRRGDLCNLPFETNSVESLSSLNVLEHCGLGRYGDALDPQGSKKACLELIRILRPGGSLYVAVPVAKIARVEFNAHRIFTPEGFMANFPGMLLKEERYMTENGSLDRRQYEAAGMPYAYGCFHFLK